MMRKLLQICLATLMLAACTEKVDLRSVSDYRDFLVVDAILTDNPDEPQCVNLTRTVSYFEDGEEPPRVPGARVSVNDVAFSEQEPGVYQAPEGYRCESGRQYNLRIVLPDGEQYEAEATMPERGFRLDAIDYAYAGNKSMGLDSLWTLALWGQDDAIASFYHITIGVNDNFYPFEYTEFVDDKYFNGNEVKGFPITTLIQSEILRKRHGDAFKYLETGDVITLRARTIEKGYYEFLLAQTLSGPTIPIFSPQPANTPTNIRGEHVLGWFAVCPEFSASVTVEDPFRPYYKRMFPWL